MKVAVIGSGPSGWATVEAIHSSEKKVEVHIFNSGINENNSIQISNSIKNSLNLKLFKGSDYPYRPFPAGPNVKQNNLNLPMSYAPEGLSLVWGATMLPYELQDIIDWGISWSEFDEAFKFVAKKVPISGRSDNLDKLYGQYTSRPPLSPSNRILKCLELSELINDSTITIGSSRLAIYSKESGNHSCIYCNKCLGGCPTARIWTSKITKSQNQRIISGIRVLKLAEKSDRVDIQGIDFEGKDLLFQDYDRVFLCTGSVETFRILSTSNLVNKSVNLKDSATFFVPIALGRKYQRIPKYNIALSQIFINLKTFDSNTAQFQIYDFSEELISRAKKTSKIAKFVPYWILRLLLSRIFVAIGYLNDVSSNSISLRLAENGDVELFTDENKYLETKMRIDETLNHLSRKIKPLNLYPIKKLVQYALPGEGVHFGGWLSMGQDADDLGRPKSSRLIHVVDSSVLPSIKSGPITFTVMANAVRIVKRVIK